MASMYRAISRMLIENGWTKTREGKGSHEIWAHPDDPDREITVTKNLKARHTANHILKQAGLPKAF